MNTETNRCTWHSYWAGLWGVPMWFFLQTVCPLNRPIRELASLLITSSPKPSDSSLNPFSDLNPAPRLPSITWENNSMFIFPILFYDVESQPRVFAAIALERRNTSAIFIGAGYGWDCFASLGRAILFHNGFLMKSYCRIFLMYPEYQNRFNERCFIAVSSTNRTFSYPDGFIVYVLSVLLNCLEDFFCVPFARPRA